MEQALNADCKEAGSGGGGLDKRLKQFQEALSTIISIPRNGSLLRAMRPSAPASSEARDACLGRTESASAIHADPLPPKPSFWRQRKRMVSMDTLTPPVSAAAAFSLRISSSSPACIQYPRKRGNGPPRSAFFTLVPKLCLETHLGAKLCFAGRGCSAGGRGHWLRTRGHPFRTKQSFACKDIPKQSLGTRANEGQKVTLSERSASALVYCKLPGVGDASATSLISTSKPPSHAAKAL